MDGEEAKFMGKEGYNDFSFVTMTLCSSFFAIHQISYSWLLFSLCKEARKAWLSSSMPFLFCLMFFFSTKVVSMQCGVHFHTDVYIHQQMHAHASNSSLMKGLDLCDHLVENTVIVSPGEGLT